MLIQLSLTVIIFGVTIASLSNSGSDVNDGNDIFNAGTPNEKGADETSACSANPCAVTAVCRDVDDTYACLCPSGYAGASCRIHSRPRKTDIVFLLDSSRSVTQTTWEKVLKFVALVSELLSGEGDLHRLGIISFANQAELTIVYRNDENTTIMREIIQDLPYIGGKTNISGALRLARQEFFAHANINLPGLENIAVIITDGTSTVDRDLTVIEARAASHQGIIIFAVGIGTEVVVDRELTDIVSQPASEHMIQLNTPDAIGTTVRSIQSHASDFDMSSIKGEPGEEGLPGQSGLPGAQGVTGEIGKSGLPGVAGIKGDSGEAGTAGVPGPVGEKGYFGAKGHPGAKGIPSFVKGSAGVQGVKGDRGDSFIGSIGAPGIYGLKGEPGERGLPGLPASPGQMGRSGESGLQGEAGSSGAKGQKGQIGVKGISGEKGAKGFHGEVGRQGMPGPPGTFRTADGFTECPLQCDHQCSQSLFGYFCECLPGYELAPHNGTCIDVNECAVKNGGCEQECANTLGTFTCSCKIGYTLSRNMRHCNDFNECCADESHPRCTSREICLNTLGSYRCLSKQIAYIPQPKPKGEVAAAHNSTGDSSVWRSTEMFIGLILWCAVLSLLTVIILLLLWFNDDKSMERLRDAHVIEQKYQKTKRFSVASNFIFPRFSTEDLTDSNPIVPGGNEKLYMRAKSGNRGGVTQRYSKSTSQDSRRQSGASVTITSPGGHVTSISA